MVLVTQETKANKVTNNSNDCSAFIYKEKKNSIIFHIKQIVEFHSFDPCSGGLSYIYKNSSTKQINYKRQYFL